MSFSFRYIKLTLNCFRLNMNRKLEGTGRSKGKGKAKAAPPSDEGEHIDITVSDTSSQDSKSIPFSCGFLFSPFQIRTQRLQLKIWLCQMLNC
jgi:hypothetical protein